MVLAPAIVNQLGRLFFRVNESQKTVPERLEYLARPAGKEDPQQYRNRHSSILFAGAPVVLIFLTRPYRSSVEELRPL